MSGQGLLWHTAGSSVAAEEVLLGPRDATGLLSLRVVRRLSLLLIPVGTGVALAAGVSQARLGTQFDSVSGWLSSLVSPLWVLAVAILLRIAVAPAAYLAALGAMLHGARVLQYDPRQESPWKRLTDTCRLAGGLRALRWTYAVRAVAVDRCGSSGVALKRAEQVIGASIWVAWVLLVVGAVVVHR